jgi:peptidylprolyl isomerase
MNKLIPALMLLCLGLTPFPRLQAQTQITFYTTMGDFVVEMTDSLTPITSGNFIQLTLQEFYDDVIFHRVIKNFVVQGGDPTGTGFGGPGYSIPDEFDSTLSNVTGTISMANAGPNTGGSQFFFNLVNNTHLDYNKPPLTSAHPVFGWVVSGWDNVLGIGNVAVNASYRPLTDVVMDSLRITYWNPASTHSLSDPLTQVSIYPNPITSTSRITVISKTSGQATFNVYDQAGRQISSKVHSLPSGYYSVALHQICDQAIRKGLYFLEMTKGEETRRLKFIR